jgi:hypothetical protein
VNSGGISTFSSWSCCSLILFISSWADLESSGIVLISRLAICRSGSIFAFFFGSFRIASSKLSTSVRNCGKAIATGPIIYSLYIYQYQSILIHCIPITITINIVVLHESSIVIWWILYDVYQQVRTHEYCRSVCMITIP